MGEMTRIVSEFCSNYPEMVNFRDNDDGFPEMVNHVVHNRARQRFVNVEVLLKHGARLDTRGGHAWAKIGGSIEIMDWLQAQLAAPRPPQAPYDFHRGEVIPQEYDE